MAKKKIIAVGDWDRWFGLVRLGRAGGGLGWQSESRPGGEGGLEVGLGDRKIGLVEGW